VEAHETDVNRQEWLADALGRYERPLVRYAHRLLGDLDRARDVAQDCFLKLCQQPPGSLDGRLKEWLFTVCRNRAIDHLRKEGRMGGLADEPAVRMEDHVARGEEQDRVLGEVARLPARQQELLRLRFQEGLSYRQIAAVARLSQSNVGYLLHTALKTLRAALGEAPAGGRNQAS